MAKYTFGGETFTSQKQVEEHFKKIKLLDIGPITPGDFAFNFLRDLYWRNPWAPLVDPTYFQFNIHPGHRGDQLGVIIGLETGELWQFPSYQWGRSTPDAALTNIIPHWRKLMQSRIVKKLRKMVAYQIDTYRLSTDGCCEHCGNQGEDVDHVKPWTFQAIKDRWLLNKDVVALYMSIIDDTVDGSAPEFSDPDVHSDWLDFHAEMAELRLLCKPCHHKVTYNR